MTAEATAERRAAAQPQPKPARTVTRWIATAVDTETYEHVWSVDVHAPDEDTAHFIARPRLAGAIDRHRPDWSGRFTVTLRSAEEVAI